MSKAGGFLSFIETPQYVEFANLCDYVHHKRKIGLVYGSYGVGKSWAARHYVQSQPHMPANGKPPYLYIHLSQADKTDRTFLNGLIAFMTGDKRPRLYTGPAMDEARRLWDKYGYQMLIIDEIWSLQLSGVEAIRTFHDSGPDQPRIPIVMITVPRIKKQFEEEIYGAFTSRIGRILCFDTFTKTQLQEILMQIPETSPLHYLPDQPDATEFLDTLYLAAGGGVKAKASFRMLDNILSWCDVELKLQLLQSRQSRANNPSGSKPPTPKLDIPLIHRAIMKVSIEEKDRQAKKGKDAA
jgi:hypothetical protein